MGGAGNGRLRIGIIAPELVDAPGGMPEFARRLAGGLAENDIVTVYAPTTTSDPHADWTCRTILSKDLARDGEMLAEEHHDVWFACNAALVALAPRLDAPLIAYCNGNDVLNPWITYPHPWVERLSDMHVVWRLHEPVLERVRRRDIRRGLRSTASLVANSSNTARIVEREHPGTADKTSVIPPGVGEDFFQTASSSGNGTLRLLTVARLEGWTARKNVDGVLRALTMLPPDLRVRYTVIGDGDDRGRLEALAASLELGGRVHFAGSVSYPELLAAYRGTDLFIMASRARENDVEGFGIVYLEAAASGVPSICSRAGGATDAVRDGETGIVLDGAEPEDIAAGIERFVRERARFDPGRIRAFAEAFRWPAITQRFRSHIGDVARDAKHRDR